MLAQTLFDGIVDKSQLDLIKDLNVNRVVINSKDVKRGDLFVCLAGSKFDGHTYAYEALRNGAQAIVSSQDLGIRNQIIVDDERSAYALLCKNFYQKACDKLKIIAITGTNGKTSISHLTGQILSAVGKKVGVIGTLGAFYNGKHIDVGLTTPDPDILHKTFKDMLDEGIEYVVMEASAHALALKKLDGIIFQSALLTNITQDHLDYFENMDKYAQAKFSLFDKSHCKFGFVCIDDQRAKTLFAKKDKNIPIRSYGFSSPSDCHAFYPQMSIHGSQFYVTCNDEMDIVRTKLLGRFNIQNILAAISLCAHENIRLEDITTSIKDIEPIPGRMNVIKAGNFNVVVDYAHTPDGLEKLLKSVREVCQGRIICVFGCGGNRDRTKRKIMGQIASKHSNYVILTSDNPRYEVPLGIIHEIEEGVNGPYEICENRADAISRGLGCCHKGDVLVIAGKGAEVTQEINGQKLPFSDIEEVYKHLSLRKDKIGEENA